MKPHVANIALAILLIAISAWGYLSSETPSMTALIPGFFGIIFLALSGPFKKENKVVAHIIVVLTLLLVISLFMPLRGAIGRSDSMATARVGIMLAAGVFALVTYIRSFINARKERAT